MDDTWITDMRHFLDVLEPDVDIPGPAKKLAEHFGRDCDDKRESVLRSAAGAEHQENGYRTRYLPR